MSRRTGIAAVARLELAEVLRSRWLSLLVILYAGLGAIFVLLGLRESNVLGFTGMGRVLASLCNVLVLLLPLLALTGSGLVVNRAREDGTLEMLFSHPVSRNEYFCAVSGVRYLALVVPLVTLFAALGFYGRVALRQPVPWGFMARALAVCAALVWSFVAAGLVVSVTVRNQAKATVYLLLIWVTAAALLDFGLIGLMLQWRISPALVFTLACLNPVESARLALVSFADPSLAALGPVGFYVADRLGPGWMLAAGIVWPAAAGIAVWLVAWHAFSRRDLV